PGEVVVEARMLDQAADEAADPRLPHRIVAGDPHPTRAGAQQPQRDAQRGRLAGAVVADEAVAVALPRVQGDPVERERGAVTVLDLDEADGHDGTGPGTVRTPFESNSRIPAKSCLGRGSSSARS